MLSLFEMCRPAPRKCVITPLGFDGVVQVNLMLLLEILDVLRPMTLPGAFSLVVAVFEATAEQPTLVHASTVSVGIVYGCKLIITRKRSVVLKATFHCVLFCHVSVLLSRLLLWTRSSTHASTVSRSSTPSHARMRTHLLLPLAFHKQASRPELSSLPIFTTTCVSEPLSPGTIGHTLAIVPGLPNSCVERRSRNWRFFAFLGAGSLSQFPCADCGRAEGQFC